MNGLYVLALAGFLGCAFLLATFELDRFVEQDDRDVRDTLRQIEDDKERRHYFAEPYDQDVDEPPRKDDDDD